MGIHAHDAKPAILADAPIIDCSFTRTGSGVVADEVKQLGTIGTGMTVGQAYSNLNIDTGTNVGAEFLFRSTEAFSGAHSARYRLSLSQRIVNQHVVGMLADMIGENVPFTVDATGLLITVRLPTPHGFTSENIGQTMMLGGVAGGDTTHPGRYTIVDVTGDSLVFSPVFYCTWTRSTTTATISFQGGAPIFSIAENATVSASSDTGAIVNGVVSLLTQGNSSNLATSTFTCLNAGATSGTLTLTMTSKAWTADLTGVLTVYGWNYIAWIRNGTSATVGWKDTQRRGWSSGASSVTKTTDAAPLGVVDQFYGDGQIEAFSDATPASQSTGLMFNQRGTAIDSLPSTDVDLYFFLSVHNGVTAPASTTRVSIGFFRMFDIGINKVQISGVDQSGYPSLMDIRVATMPTTTQVAGSVAEGSTIGNPVTMGVKSSTAIQTARTAGQNVAVAADKIGRVANVAQQIRDLNTTSPMVTLSTTTETTIVSAVASIFNDLKAAIVTNTSATATRVDFRDTTAGTVRFSVMAEAGKTIVVNFPDVMARQATVNTNWTAQLGTAVTDVRITPLVIQVN